MTTEPELAWTTKSELIILAELATAHRQQKIAEALGMPLTSPSFLDEQWCADGD